MSTPQGETSTSLHGLLPSHQARNHQPPPGYLRHPRRRPRTIRVLTSKIKQPALPLRQLGSQLRLRLRYRGPSLGKRLIQ
ncbi:hypothetical protein [uncultured Corynebacterium sp.]|uniref:hypothetical protein n=1 Tax=uncultured Corynebacterium sp. TaxID=159447 RepID=UPI0028D5426B|nr:hypothetical protein [uncultured Corynebacterium sp.]